LNGDVPSDFLRNIVSDTTNNYACGLPGPVLLNFFQRLFMFGTSQVKVVETVMLLA
jgi:hypothetical protein